MPRKPIRSPAEAAERMKRLYDQLRPLSDFQEWHHDLLRGRDEADRKIVERYRAHMGRTGGLDLLAESWTVSTS
jgi:hypothetical protein